MRLSVSMVLTCIDLYRVVSSDSIPFQSIYLIWSYFVADGEGPRPDFWMDRRHPTNVSPWFSSGAQHFPNLHYIMVEHEWFAHQLAIDHHGWQLSSSCRVLVCSTSIFQKSPCGTMCIFGWSSQRILVCCIGWLTQMNGLLWFWHALYQMQIAKQNSWWLPSSSSTTTTTTSTSTTTTTTTTTTDFIGWLRIRMKQVPYWWIGIVWVKQAEL